MAFSLIESSDDFLYVQVSGVMTMADQAALQDSRPRPDRPGTQAPGARGSRRFRRLGQGPGLG